MSNFYSTQNIEDSGTKHAQNKDFIPLDRAGVMEFSDYTRIVRDRWAWIVAIFLACLALSVAITAAMAPVYASKATLFVTVNSPGDTAYAQSQFATQRVGSYSQLVNNPEILQSVIDELKLDMSVPELKDWVSVTNPTDTVLLQVVGRASNPEVASAIANSLAAKVAKQVTVLEKQPGSNLNVVPVLSVPALPAQYPESPRKMINYLLGGLLGICGGLIAAMAVNKWDRRLFRGQDVERKFGVRLLGETNARPVPAGARVDAEERNDYRQLASNLLMVNDGRVPPRILFLAVDNNSQVDVAKFAAVLGDMGQTVCLIEGDHDSIPNFGHAADGPGISQILGGQVPVEKAVTDSEELPLGYIPAGNSLFPLRSFDVYQRVPTLLNELEKIYNVIIVVTRLDARPLDGAVVAPFVDCVIVTCAARKTLLRRINLTLRELSAIRAGTTGIVVARPRRWWKQ